MKKVSPLLAMIVAALLVLALAVWGILGGYHPR